jgi:hypothetical protein
VCGASIHSPNARGFAPPIRVGHWPNAPEGVAPAGAVIAGTSAASVYGVPFSDDDRPVEVRTNVPWGPVNGIEDPCWFAIALRDNNAPRRSRHNGWADGSRTRAVAPLAQRCALDRCAPPQTWEKPRRRARLRSGTLRSRLARSSPRITAVRSARGVATGVGPSGAPSSRRSGGCRPALGHEGRRNRCAR